jgi:hypothetical protein
MKILFLDIDGVLNSHEDFRTTRSTTGKVLNMDMVARLKTIIERTDAKVVISSTWRRYPKHMRFFRDKTGIRYIAMTPVIEMAGSYLVGDRGEEIQRWMDTHKAYDIESYVILDDENDFLPHQQEHFVETGYYHGGLLGQHVEKAVEILNKQKEI